MYTPLDFYLALEMLIAQFGNPFPSSFLVVEVEVEVDSTQPLGYGKVWKRLGLRSSSENYYHGDLPSPL